MTGDAFQFGEFTLDETERQLSRRGEVIHLPPKAYDLLIALVSEAGHLVTKDQLLGRVWPDAFVEPGILTVHIATLRKALGDDRRPCSYIETVPRSGYRFIAPVARMGRAADVRTRETARPVAVHELVGRGRAQLLSGSYFALPEAVAAFRAAIEIDPDYAAAHAGLALALCTRATVRVAPPHEAYSEAKVSAQRALALAPASADAHVALGTVLFLSEWAWAAAEQSLRRALEINSAHTEGLLQYGALMEALGQLDDGLRLKQRALERDAPSALVLVQIALSYWHQRKYEDARAWAQRALEIDPRHFLARECLASVCWALGDLEGFAAELLNRVTPSGASEEALSRATRFGAALHHAHSSGGAAGVARFMLEFQPGQGAMPMPAVQRAVMSGAAGRPDDAFEYLDQAITCHDPALVHLAVAPQWDPLRADSRFAERLKRMALPTVA